MKIPSTDNPLTADLDFVIQHTSAVWSQLRGQRLFITGGTGFFGRWLLESLVWANDRLDLDVSAVALSRDPAAFAIRAPHLAKHRALRVIEGDVRHFEFPTGRFSHIIHGATESTTDLAVRNPLAMFDAIVGGTRRALDFARHCGATKFLLTSSGAVYGRQPPELTHIPEEYRGAPDPTDSATSYAQGKRAAEFLCATYHAQHGIETKIARGFAFVGPHLPIDIHFAIGNFIRDALHDDAIRVNGDGRPFRSYLYAADLAIWLWTILTAGRPGAAYNLGSDEEFTIAAVAQAVAARLDPPPPVIVAQPPGTGPAPRYVPSIARARSELGLEPWTKLPDAIDRTLAWHRSQAMRAS